LAGAYLVGANLDGANLDGANLDVANLDGANLDAANLAGANLDGERLSKTPISILNLTWDVLITDNYMRIGCQRHTHTDWEAFTNDEIQRMENRASEFWKNNRDWLLAACKSHRSK
jgi:uncharacterized protein YjbI with pentapeptide repeats